MSSLMRNAVLVVQSWHMKSWMDPWRNFKKTLEDMEKDLKALTSKKKKVTTLINQYQEKLSKSQENVTITEGEIYTIEENNVMSNNEVEILAKLEEAIEKSRQKIISFKIFQLLDFFYLLKIF